MNKNILIIFIFIIAFIMIFKKTIEHLDQGLTPETKKKFKNFFLTCIIIVLFILSVTIYKPNSP